jgi:hypothetical protein
MHVNAHECLLNVGVEDPLEALPLCVLLVRASHLLGEARDADGRDGASLSSPGNLRWLPCSWYALRQGLLGDLG